MGLIDLLVTIYNLFLVKAPLTDSIKGLAGLLTHQRVTRVYLAMVVGGLLVIDELEDTAQFILHTNIFAWALAFDTLTIVVANATVHRRTDLLGLFIVFYDFAHLVNPILIHLDTDTRLLHVILCTAAHFAHYFHIYMFCYTSGIVTDKLWTLLVLEIIEALINMTLFWDLGFLRLSQTLMAFSVYHSTLRYESKKSGTAGGTRTTYAKTESHAPRSTASSSSSKVAVTNAPPSTANNNVHLPPLEPQAADSETGVEMT